MSREEIIRRMNERPFCHACGMRHEMGQHVDPPVTYLPYRGFAADALRAAIAYLDEHYDESTDGAKLDGVHRIGRAYPPIERSSARLAFDILLTGDQWPAHLVTVGVLPDLTCSLWMD